MKTAGMIKIPLSVTREIYEYVISVMATEIARSKEEGKDGLNKTFLLTIDKAEEFRKSLDTAGTRDLLKAYKESVRSIISQVTPVDMPPPSQNLFTGIANPTRRAEIKAFFNPLLDRAVKYCNAELQKSGADEWERLITVDLPRNVLSSGHAIRKFEFEIDHDWYPDLVGGKGGKEKITVEVERRTPRQGGYSTRAGWGGRMGALGGLLVVFLFETDYNMSPEWLQREVWKSVVHEMTHSSQFMISNFLPKGKGKPEGLPSKKIRTPQFDQHMDKTFDNYLLDDIEFYTKLRDATSDIMRHLNRITDHQMKNLAFRLLVGDTLTREEQQQIPIPTRQSDLFFSTMRRRAPLKWKKAVGEAYKIVFNTSRRLATKKKTDPNMPKYRDPNAQGMFDGTGVGSSGKGQHGNRTQDVAKGRSRKEKHKKDLAKEAMASRIARVFLEKDEWKETDNKKFDAEQAEQLWTLYDIAYGSIGKHIGSKAELINKYPLFEVMDNDESPDIDIFIAMKKTPHGKKIAAMGHDGRRESKKAVVLKMLELLNTRGYYTEASDAVEALLRRGGLDNIKDEKVIMDIMGEKGDIQMEGNGYYSRGLGSIGRHTKALFGKPLI